MNKKIESLTKEQEQQMIAYREHCRCRGLCTDPAAKVKAENAITKFYEKLGKKKPYFWHCGSVWMCEIIINILSQIKIEKGVNLRANLGAKVWDNLWANLGDNLRDNLRVKLKRRITVNATTTRSICFLGWQ